MVDEIAGLVRRRTVSDGDDAKSLAVASGTMVAPRPLSRAALNVAVDSISAATRGVMRTWAKDASIKRRRK